MQVQSFFNVPTSIDDMMSKNDQIAVALADLESQIVFNYSTTAKNHLVVQITIIRQFTGENISNYKVTKEYRQALNIAQWKMTFGTPSTLMLLRNFLEEIYEDRLEKNWNMQFIQHYLI